MEIELLTIWLTPGVLPLGYTLGHILNIYILILILIGMSGQQDNPVYRPTTLILVE